MAHTFRFQSLCGTVYRNANLLFSPDGNTVFSAVGNRVTAFELTEHLSWTLPVENRRDIAAMALSPDGGILVTVDKDGRALVVAMARRAVLHRINFKSRPRTIRFSPDGKLLAVTAGRTVQIWLAPPRERLVAPMTLIRTLTGHFDDVTDVSWAPNSIHLITASLDATARIHTAFPVHGFVPVTLSGHRGPLVMAAFSSASKAHTVSSDGAVFTWLWERRAVLDRALVAGLSGAGKGTITPGNLDDLLDAGMATVEDEFEDEQEDGATAEMKRARPGDGDEEEEDDEDEDVDENKEQDGDQRPRRLRTTGTARTSSAVGARRTREKHVVPDPAQLGTEGSMSIAVGEWVLRGRHLFMQDGARVVSASFNVASQLLVAGFDNGVFSLYSLSPTEDARVAAGLVSQEAPKSKVQLAAEAAAAGSDAVPPPSSSSGFRQPATDTGLTTAGDAAALTASSGVAASTCDAVHSLSIGTSPVTTAVISPAGDWLAFGTAETGQLLVWEWQSESYILKQRGHAHVINALAWSPDSQAVATGGDDGKIKLWSAKSGFCFVTFADHRAPVTSLCFIGGRGGRAQAILSASLDGTVRAFDLSRYRNFRTMAAPTPRQFSCIHADPDGELVAAGSIEPFEICVWSMRTGKLLDILSGHEGPITAVRFAPESSLLASASWDTTVRIWDPAATGGGGAATETFKHGADVLDVAWRPDGKRIVAATRDGQLHFWDPHDGRQTGVIAGRRDMASGRLSSSEITARSADSARHFSCVQYSADGGMVVAGGRSNFVCVYAAEERLLLRKFPLTHSRDIDGVLRLLNSSRLTDTGVSRDTMDGGHDAMHAGEDSDARLARKGRGMGISADAALPGAQRATAASARAVLRETRCRALAFAPTGRSMAVAAVEGLMLFGQDDTVLFEPIELTAEVTPSAIRAAIAAGDAPKALAMALHLNDKSLVVAAAAAVGPADAYIASQAVPARLVPRLLALLAEPVRTSKHLELWLTLVIAVMTTHAAHLRAHPASSAAPVRAILRAVSAHRESLARLAEDNADMVRFLASGAAAATTIAEATEGGWKAAQLVGSVSQPEAEATVAAAAVARLSHQERATLQRVLAGRTAPSERLATFPHFDALGFAESSASNVAAGPASLVGGTWEDLPSAWTD